jgi:signal peptidase I
MFDLAKEFLEALIMALVVFFFLQVSVQNFQVEGSSMYPTLESGEYVAVNKLAYLRVNMDKFSDMIPFWDASGQEEFMPFQKDGPGRGSIVVFSYPRDPDRSFVKRVIGVPGDQISIRDGYTYLNGKLLDEPYVPDTERSRGEFMDFKTLGPDEYFVMGDNRTHSNDSRHWGPLGIDYIIGNKWVAYDLPLKIGFINQTEAPN